MKNNCRYKLIQIIALTVALVTLSHADEVQFPLDHYTSYVQLKELSLFGKRDDVITEANIYLNEHPTDSDVRLLLGQMYFNNKEYQKAQQQLTIVLQQTPTYSDASLVLSNVEMSLANYRGALDIVNASLLLNPIDVDLLKKKADIENAIVIANKYQGSPSGLQKRHIKKSSETVATPKKQEEKKYLNEIGIYQQQYYISDVKKVWDYSTLYYGRVTPIGKVYGKINYSNRFEKQAIQGEIEAFPKINKYIYLDLDVAYANQPNLFASQAYGAEAYVSLDKLFNFSAGGKYNLVDQRHNFTMYTGSISKALTNNLITFRPYYFVPGVGESSTLYTINLRHIVLDPYYYFGCVFGLGKSPDLANLTTISFIVVQNKIVNPYINFPLFNERLIVNLGLLYQNQIFPRNKIRNWSGGTVGLAWKF